MMKEGEYNKYLKAKKKMESLQKLKRKIFDQKLELNILHETHNSFKEAQKSHTKKFKTTIDTQQQELTFLKQTISDQLEKQTEMENDLTK